MTRTLLYSIKPEHIANILNGKKTVEVRKRDLPAWAIEALKRGEKVIGYGYCTMGLPYVAFDCVDYDDSWGMAATDCGYFTYKSRYELDNERDENWPILNGHVVVRFEIDHVIPFEFIGGQLCVKADSREQQLQNIYYLNEEATCLTYEQLQDYVGNKMGYAHHLTAITPIEPKKLSEFHKEEDIAITEEKNGRKRYSSGTTYLSLVNSPQSFMTAWVEEK